MITLCNFAECSVRRRGTLYELQLHENKRGVWYWDGYYRSRTSEWTDFKSLRSLIGTDTHIGCIRRARTIMESELRGVKLSMFELLWVGSIFVSQQIWSVHKLCQTIMIWTCFTLSSRNIFTWKLLKSFNKSLLFLIRRIYWTQHYITWRHIICYSTTKAKCLCHKTVQWNSLFNFSTRS